MPDDTHSQLAQVLHRPPNFRTRRAQLFRNARAADDQRRIVAQQPDDAPQARVGKTFRRLLFVSICS